MIDPQLVAFSIIAEIIFTGFSGFILGWLVVLGTDVTINLKIKISVALFFSAISIWLAVSAPAFILTFYTFKIWFISLLSAVCTYFFFDDPHLNKKKRKLNLINAFLVLLSMLLFLLFLTFISHSIAYVVAQFIA